MGLGYIFMIFASKEASAEAFGKAAMIWIFLAYLFHTIGELCTSPVALSFITKLAPLKYASIMMGVYFAATGVGNKLAGNIGEAAQLEPYVGEMVVSKDEIIPFLSQDSIKVKNTQKEIVTIYDYPINEDKNFNIKSEVYIENEDVVFRQAESGVLLNDLFEIENEEKLVQTLKAENANAASPYHARLTFEKDKDKAQALENKGDGKDYDVSFVLEEQQSEREYKTFLWLTIFTVSFGLLLILFLNKLKKLTHGAEDKPDESIPEQENFALGDEDLNEESQTHRGE